MTQIRSDHFRLRTFFLTGQAPLSPCQIDYSVAISKVIDTTKDFKFLRKVNLGTSSKKFQQATFRTAEFWPLTNKLHIVITTKAN